MTNRRFRDSPQLWIEQQAASEAPFRWSSDQEAADYLNECILFYSDFEAGASIDAATLDAALWTIHQNQAYIIFDGLGTLDRQVASVTLAAAWLVHRYANATEWSRSLFQFWDSVLTQAGSDYPPVLVEAVFAALTYQLASPNPHVQISALHGLNHLRHPRTVWVIDALVGPIGDAEVRAYAAIAKRFEAL